MSATPQEASLVLNSSITNKTSFDVGKVTFYKAVAWFEAEQYQGAFNLFLDCAKKVNLYAPFYLQYLLDPNTKIKIEQTEIQKKEIAHILQFLPMIPKMHRPESWCLASRLIIRLNKVKKDKEKAKKKLLEQLSTLAEYASNAGLALLDYHEYCKNEKSYVEINLIKRLLKHRNIYLLHELQKRNLQTAQTAKEYLMVEKYANLTSIGGALETLISRSYNGQHLGKKTELEQDPAAKLRWQITGAHMGSKDLQLMFASPTPDEEEIFHEESILWLFMAALNDEPQAQLTIAPDLIEGDNPKIPQDIPLAVHFYKKAIGKLKTVPEQLSQHLTLIALAYLHLGEISEKGLTGEPKNDKEALEYYQQAAALDCPLGYKNIGVFYSSGRGGLEKSEAKAVFNFEKGLECTKNTVWQSVMPIDLSSFHYNIAYLYQNTKGNSDLKQDLAKSAQHYKIGATDNIDCLYEYARQRYEGIGVTENKEEGLRLLIKAAEKKQLEAIRYICAEYFSMKSFDPGAYGLSIEKMCDYLLSLQINDSTVESIIGLEYYKTRNYKKALEFAKKGADLQQPGSLVLLAHMYENGIPELNIPKDFKTALNYNEKAAALGSADALSNLGYYFMSGYGCAQDYKKARELLEKALTQQVYLAAYNLSVLYRKGLGVAKDRKKEFEYLKIAEKTNDPEVLNNLGLCYYGGFGTLQDLKLGKAYLAKAASLGYPPAEFSCASILINDCLTKRSFDFESIKQILKWLQSTPKVGIPRANFIYAMIILLTNPDATENVVELLKTAPQQRPYHKSTFALKILLEEQTLSQEKIIFLLTHEVSTQEEVATFFKQFPAKVSPTAAVQKTVLEKKQQTETVPDNTAVVFERLKIKLESFINAHKKNIDIHKFNHLIGKLLTIKGVSGGISHSKSSNIQYSIKLPTQDKTLTFSYHPIHRKNSSQDSDYDPKRRESMQQFVKNIVSELPLAAKK